MTATGLVGEKIGRYRIERRIGGGGMGEVYLGTVVGDGGFTRKVAIKRLRPEHAQRGAFVTMLLDEARLASSIRSPHVVATLDVVQEEGEFYVVMDYVEGHSLDTLVLASTHVTQVPAPVAAALVIGLLTGLGAAHAATDGEGNAIHLVHRDVSPHNVLVGSDGVVRVIDFGVAKAKDRLQTTQTGEVKGKPTYMAPEQLLALDVDHRADLFAAGAVFWELLTGKRFKANERLLARERDDVLAPPPSNEGGPSTYDAVCARALAMLPANRYEDAAAMIAAIEAAGPVASAAEVKSWSGRALLGEPMASSSVEIFVEHESFLVRESEIVPRAVATASMPPPAPPVIHLEKKRNVAPLVVLGVVAVAVGLGAAVLVPRVFSSPVVPASQVASQEAPGAASSAPPVASPVVAASSSVVPEAPLASAPARRNKKLPVPAPKTTHEAPKPDCREPFVVLPDGTKVPRRECFP